MRFTKMHGLGNDYIYVNCFQEDVPEPAACARRISDRHFGVGSDGLILIRPPRTSQGDCRMEMYNADGSRAQMCGNGIRCVAKYFHERLRGASQGGGRAQSQNHGNGQRADSPVEIRIETDAGLKIVRVETGADGKVRQAEVNMGSPRLARAAIPMADGGDPREPAVNVPLEVCGRAFRVTAVSMGNPHAVLRVEESGEERLAGLPLLEWGPRFERHPAFPERTNTEFVSCRSRREMDLRVWERGSGETLACGTGACAAVVAGVLNNWCDRDVLVHLRGGDLQVRWEEASDGPAGAWPPGGNVYLTGPAEEVFSGEW